MDPLLRLSVSVRYPGRPDVLRDVSLEVREGEALGLIGQSGSGKSTLALAILQLLRFRGAQVRGRIDFRGRNLLEAGEREMRAVRGREIALVPQSPVASLNPMMRLGSQLREAWRAHTDTTAAERDAALHRALEDAALPTDAAFLRLYPRQLSVGLAQRVLIAMAVLHRPPLLLADEPTSALDALTQAEILALFQRLNRANGTAILYVSHDLRSVRHLCHRVAILHGGGIVECGETATVFERPQHPYTQRLLAT